MPATLFRFRLEIADTPEPNMEAYFYALPVEADQTGQVLSRPEILTFLKSLGVVFGILDHAIERIVQRGYAHRELIARGLAPLRGSDAYFQVLVSDRQSRYEALFSRLPRPEDEKWLDRLMSMTVQAGSPLLRRLPACPGAPGRNIKGQLVSGYKGMDRPFPPFYNAQISPQDKHLLVAMNEGIPAVDLPHLIEVLPLTIIRRDLAESRYFKGIVAICGNIPDQIRVRAESDILVLGTVDAAVLLSGRRIWIRQGVKGKDIAVLKARDDILLRFAERATLESGGHLRAESLHHCHAVALGELRVNYILGGWSRSTTLCWTDVVGSPGVDSALCCGQNAYLDSALAEAEQQIAQLEEKLLSMRSVLSSKDMLQAADKQILRLYYRNRIPRLEYLLYHLKFYWRRLQGYQAASRQAAIEIETGIYPGTLLMIHQLEMEIQEFVNQPRRYLAGRYGIMPDRTAVYDQSSLLT
ncbi:MAG: hypothetical protein CVV27_11000 [Candidatus Melainabacteria bacterium HGW-Melainabacteria-1]|nr:MAG: hypothetical protein CVV27_11000 [Candidatus Melainabacteria bacterium HGW-Melainabacteria-1]